MSRLLLQSGALTSMATNLEVRLLLELWNPNDIPMGHGILNKRLTGKNPDTGENLTALEKNTAREKLMTEGSIVPGTKGKLKGFVLTDSGKTALADALVRSKFTFKTTIISTRTANALLEWFRSNPVSAKPIEKAAGSTIESYEAFKVVALETFDRLNRDFNLDNLVPIYRIRREIGERVERSEFDRWLLEMQAADIFQLQGGSLPDGDTTKLEDSITTELSGLRCYATLLAS